jgi:CrcB protein
LETLTLVALGGALGSVARFLLSSRLQGWVGAAFPWGTLAVNVVGCLLIGVLSGAADGRGAVSPNARAFLMVGVLGGFTTFSSFGYETLQLTRDGEMGRALVNIAANVVVGLAAAWGGYQAGRGW